MRIGLISDTHGLLRPEALDALQGVDHILHAGDVGKPFILEALRQIAPLTVVRGNVDRGAWAEALPMTEAVSIGGLDFYMVHILEDLDIDPQAAGFHAVIYGHTHKPKWEQQQQVWYINPGSAGPRRFSLPICMAYIDLKGKELTITSVPLT